MAWPEAERASGIGSRKARTGELARSGTHDVQDVALTAKRVGTSIGIMHDAGHAEPWIIAMSAEPSDLSTLDYSRRCGIEPMSSDFKTRGFGLEDSQTRYPDRLAGLILVATMLRVRSANLVELASGLPRPSDRWDMGYQWHGLPMDRARPGQRLGVVRCGNAAVRPGDCAKRPGSYSKPCRCQNSGAAC